MSPKDPSHQLDSHKALPLLLVKERDVDDYSSSFLLFTDLFLEGALSAYNT